MSDRGFYHSDSEKEPKVSASPEELQDREQSATEDGERGDASEDRSLDKGGLYKAESGSGLASKGLMAAAGLSGAGVALKFLKNHKKGIGIGGGGAIGFVISLVLFFGFVASYELVTIEKDMLRYEQKGLSYVIKKAANDVFNKMYCRTQLVNLAKVSGCYSSNKADGVSGQDGNKVKALQDGDPMTAEIDSFNFTDPQVVKSLADQGIQVEKSGTQVRLRDLNNGNKLITYEDLNNPDIAARIDTAIPAFDIGQLQATRGMLTMDEGADWDIVNASEETPNETQAEVDTQVDKAVRESIDGTLANEPTQLQEAQAQEEQSKTGSGSTTTPPEDVQVGIATDNQIINTATAAEQAGNSEAEVISKTEAAISPKLGNALLATAVLATLCSIQKAATTASNYRIPTILAYLVRHSSTLLSIADEPKVPGAITGKQQSAFISLLNGNSSVQSTSKAPDQTIKDAAMPFSRSAAWQRMIGNPVNSNPKSSGYNPDFSQSLLPVKNAGNNIVNTINSVLGDTGLLLVCKVIENSFFGHIFSIVGTLATLAIDFSTLGVYQVALSGAVITFQQATKHVIIPEIVKYFTPVAMNGMENAVQWMNNADAGTNIATNMNMQRLGGVPLTTAQAAVLNAKGTQLANAQERSQSFVSRVFSFNNPESLVSRLAVDLPLSQSGIINSMFSDIIKAPSLLAHSLADLIGGAKVFAATTTNPGAPYDITQYGFTSIDTHDPIRNEYFLFHTVVPYGNNTKTLIQLLGDPSSYPYGSYDTNTNDLMHCFALDPFGQNGQVSSSQLWAQQSGTNSPDPICGTMGNLSTDVAPVQIQASNVAQYVICPVIGSSSSSSQNCDSTVTSFLQSNDVINRYRQYILDDEVTSYINVYQSTKS